jgi:hypothetical protein
MRTTTLAAIAASALILAAIAGWTTGSNRPLQAKASSAMEAQIDTFSMMASEQGLPTQEFEDFSLVFSAPVAQSRSPTPTP